jgi:hypothetical protein
VRSRFKRILGSLAAVFVAYSAYAVLAVPFLEPTIELAAITTTDAEHAPEERSRDFEQLFPEGAWELQRPKVLETDRGTIVFDDYEVLPDRHKKLSRLKLDRCSLIVYMGSPDDQRRRPLVLRAPQGAMLFFDGELNISRGKFGRLIGGELSGEITIYSPPTRIGDDGLEIKTRDVRIEERRIWTPQDVAFRYGANSGTGRDLSITLHPPSKLPDAPRSKSRLGRVKSFELVRVDKINLLLPTEKLSPQGLDVAGSDQNGNGTTLVEIKCRGPLQFDFDEYVLSLNDQVDVVRQNNNGPSDQLNCQQLLIHFHKPSDEDQLEDDSSIQFKPQKIVALGLPVMLRVDSMGALARGEQLEYDFATRRIWIQDREGVLLRDERLEVTSTEIEYELGDEGRLGRMWAAGPGRATGTLGKQQRRFETTWKTSVRLQSFRGAKVLSLVDDARVVIEGTGNVAARELHVFLAERPRPDNPQRFTIAADRMKAVGNVRFYSPRLTGTLEEANIWFTDSVAATDSQNNSNNMWPAATRSAPSPPPLFERLPDEQQTVRRLKVSAQLLNAELTQGKTPQIIQLAAQGNVHCEEVDAAQSQGIAVDCDVFELVDANTENPIATLTGRPARVAADGAVLAGKRIAVHQGSNIAEIRGPGEMTLPRPSTPQQPWHVKWQQRMRFDGHQAQFVGDVLASGIQAMQAGEQVHLNARGESLSVELTRFVDFKQPDDAEEVGLRDLMFRGSCSLESQTVGVNGMRRTADRMQVRDLSIDQTSGQIHADGPGWLTSVHYGEELFREGQLSTVAKGLNFLRVDFQRELAGNLNTRQMEFLGDVRTVYGPVSSWDRTIDASNPTQLGPRDVMVTAQRLAIADTGQTRERFDAVELEATGNAFVRGQTFTASGQRVSYVRAKDQLVLEGDGRNLAVLAYQATPNATPAPLKARKILFWPETKQFELNDFRSLDLDNLGQYRRETPATR